MELIWITSRIESQPSYNETRQQLDLQWIELLNKLNADVLVLPMNLIVLARLTQTSPPPSGIILSGGNDLPGVKYTEENQLRDECESLLYDWAVAKKIPLLGICRGMQLILSKNGCQPAPILNHAATTHVIKMKESFLLDIFGPNALIDSHHCFGFHQIPQLFRAIAIHLTDQSIEAVTHKELSILGLMWHPERNPNLREKNLKILATFFHLSIKT